MTKHTILFLAANPSGTDRRALDREAHSIRGELERSGYRDCFTFETRWAAEPQDLLRGLRDLKPTVVHFSGQGGENGLFFQNADGDAQIVSPAALAETFGAAGASVKLVVLSACYSEASAEALLAHVECVVGMRGALHNDAARSFAIGFYGALGEHESVAAAYQHGNAAIGLEGLSDVERPRLKVREGTDAAHVVLAAAASTVHADTYSRKPADPAASAVTAHDAELDSGEGTLYFHKWKRVADDARPTPGPPFVRWIVIGLGAACLVSGGGMAIASEVPAKGILGQLGLGSLLVTLALVYDHIPRKEMAGTLRWIIGSVVVLILGLAYASVTGIYEAVTAGRVSRKADRPSNPEAIEVNSGEGLRPVEVMSSTEGRVRDEAVSIASVHEENADEAAADKAAADKAAADKKLVMDNAAADKAAAEKAAADGTKAAAEKASADELKQPTATKPMDKLPAETNPADGVGAVPSEGWVELTSKPSAKILVNGNDTGLSTPVTGRSLALPAGRHRITFHVDGDKYTFTVVVKAGETVTLNKELQ